MAARLASPKFPPSTPGSRAVEERGYSLWCADGAATVTSPQVSPEHYFYQLDPQAEGEPSKECAWH